MVPNSGLGPTQQGLASGPALGGAQHRTIPGPGSVFLINNTAHHLPSHTCGQSRGPMARQRGLPWPLFSSSSVNDALFLACFFQ